MGFVLMLLKDLSQQKLLSHSGRCFDIRFSIDGSCLLTASEDGTAKLWDVKTRKVRAYYIPINMLDLHATRFKMSWHSQFVISHRKNHT